MKTKLFMTLAVVCTLILGACSNDELLGVSGSDNQVTFTAQLPGNISSRAFSDGTTATKLTCYVYQQTGDDQYTYVTKEEADVEGLSASVSFNLIKGETYKALFWAQAIGAPYSFDEKTATMSMKYTSDSQTEAKANDETRDAFYANHDLTVQGAANYTVTLTRPFAQVNVGAADLAEAKTAGYIFKTAALTASTYTEMNLLTGEAIGDPKEITFAEAQFPSTYEDNPEKFPVQDDTDENGNTISYEYLAMDYLLLNEAQELTDVVLSLTPADGSTISTVKEVTFSNVPVRRNYRTNIYGTLFTDQISYKVLLDQKFKGETNVKIGIEKPKTDSTDENLFLITSQAELNWIADQINSTADNFLNKKTFSLQNDIYLEGEWSPIGTDYSHRFEGKFLGNGHTIYNMQAQSNNMTGFFGFFNGQVEDLNFDNALVISNHWAGVVAGFSDNDTGSCHITNCKVTNSSVILSAEWLSASSEWDNGDKGGLIIGYMAMKDQVENCTVENCTLQGYRDLGGIIGYANGSVVKGNSVNGLTITVDNEHNYKNYTTIGTGGNDANGVVGEASASATVEGNTATNVIIGAPVADGVTQDADGNYSVSSADGLSWLAGEVNGTNSRADSYNTFSKKTITLTKDIDLSGVKWVPVGNVAGYPSITFAGTFDGNGHTISNLTASDYSVNYASAGLFGSITGTVKNLTLKNVDIKSSHYAGAFVGFSSTNGCHIINCHVIGGSVYSEPESIDGKYDNGDKVGGIVGYTVSKDIIEDCSVEGLTITAYRDLGGIVGATDGTIKNCSVKNTTINMSNKNGYKTERPTTIGYIWGRNPNGGVVEEGNTYENVTLNTLDN